MTRAASIVLVLLACLGFADDGAMSGIGGGVKLMSGHKTVRMVSESVYIKLPECRVRAMFVFRNEGPATTVKIGFPETGYNEQHSDKTAFGYFKWFTSSVDGTPIRVKRQLTTSGEAGYEAWWIKTVRFGRNQTRTIVNEYQASPGWDTSGNRFFAYVLATGASWKGTIGEGTITVDAPEIERLSDFKLGPFQFVKRGRVWRTYFTNLEPSQKSDIGISWWNGFRDFVVNGRPMRSAERPWQPWDDARTRGNQPPRVVGNEVWLPVRAAAAILGADLKTARSGAMILSRNGKHLTIRRGSRRLTKAISFHHAPATERTWMGASLMVELGPIVKAFGGKCWWADKTLQISLPKS